MNMVNTGFESDNDLAHVFLSYPRRRLGLHGMPVVIAKENLFMLTQVTRKIANMYGGKHSKAWHTNFPA